ncbi:MAG: hypothetical protein Phog2KO_09970 [Phototrophicaceae bacterium]
MKVIVLTGLVSIEKAQLTRDLATYFTDEKSVVVIDNIARLALEDSPETVTVKRYSEDISKKLGAILQENPSDIAIVALSEQAHPEKLFIELDDLQEQRDDWQIYTLALIDTRTCDCFPNVREALELYADISIMMPYSLDEVLTYVNHA